EPGSDSWWRCADGLPLDQTAAAVQPQAGWHRSCPGPARYVEWCSQPLAAGRRGPGTEWSISSETDRDDIQFYDRDQNEENATECPSTGRAGRGGGTPDARSAASAPSTSTTSTTRRSAGCAGSCPSRARSYPGVALARARGTSGH